MIDFELEELHRCDNWRRLLSCYHLLLEQQASTADTNGESVNEDSADGDSAGEKDAKENPEGWLSRLQSVEGVDDESLSRIHGQLIAWGFLTFRLAGRTAGIQYQISLAGKRALARHLEPV